MTEPLLEVSELHTHLHTPDGIVRAVDGLDLTIDHGETVCIVGESGGGKSLTCDTITGLVGPSAEVSGSVTLEGRELLSMGDRELRTIRGNRIAYLFQNAQNALDPVYTVGEQIIEASDFHRDLDGDEARALAIELLQTVGLAQAAERIDHYPHELSDGMCQRVAIAIALGGDPDLLIADEPTSALDLMTQARIIEVLDRLRSERSLAMLLVTHDLRVAAALADRIVVLYGGTGVEQGPVESVFAHPGHPYTQELFRNFLGGGDDTPVFKDIPSRGCRFQRECPFVKEQCRDERPTFEPVIDATSHEAACIYHGEGYDREVVMDHTPDIGNALKRHGNVVGIAARDPYWSYTARGEADE